jgi:hypothetical protein
MNYKPDTGEYLNASLIFLDYIALWFPKQYRLKGALLADKLMRYFYSDEFFPPKAISHKSGNFRVLPFVDERLVISINKTNFEIHFRGSFFPNIPLDKQIQLLWEFMNAFTAILDDRKMWYKVDDYKMWTPREFLHSGTVSRIDIASNVFGAVNLNKTNIDADSRTLAKNIELFSMPTLSFNKKTLEEKRKANEAGDYFKVYMNPENTKITGVTVGNRRDKNSLIMRIYDKSIDPNNLHDNLKFGTTNFYRWEYELHNRINKSIGIYDFTFITEENIIDAWNYCNRRYTVWFNAEISDHNIPKPKKRMIPKQEFNPIPAIIGYLKGLDHNGLDMTKEIIFIIEQGFEHDLTLDLLDKFKNGDNWKEVIKDLKGKYMPLHETEYKRALEQTVRELYYDKTKEALVNVEAYVNNRIIEERN